MFTVATECGGRTVAGSGRRRPEAPIGPHVHVPGREELQARAEGMATAALRWPGSVGLTVRRWELLAASDAFEAWVIGWPPGGAIALHDHGQSAGAVVVAGGELVETFVAENVDGGVATTTRRMTTWSTWPWS
ncbi:MAG TPA: hypothetical protein VN816_07020 [Acidimicrobiales bacterium]|nr:hypothetical protein [Acidimicrobiales bacterium]